MLAIDRITSNPNMMNGKACIRGMRITVSLVLNLIANGMSREAILAEYPYLEAEDIAQCLNYAAYLAEEELYTNQKFPELRFLLDMGVSESVSLWLKSLGHDAVHLNEQSLHLLDDLPILEKAIAEKRTVLTTDMDFGKLLALKKHTQASVIQFRTSDFTPANIREKLELVFEGFEGQLDDGFIITVEDNRVRFRKLPI